MKTSTIKWHLGRDNCKQLANFCEKNKVRSQTEITSKDTFNITFTFNNGGFITAELLRGTANQSFSVADHFQVVTYGFGN